LVQNQITADLLNAGCIIYKVFDDPIAQQVII
jgi:hypothetical protein